MTTIFDSYAWIEYFAGTKKGEAVKQIIETADQIYTPSICLTEIKAKYLRENKPHRDRIEFILIRSVIVDITKEIALLAAEIKQNEGLSAADAIIYAAAATTKGILLSGDQHFKGKKNVEFLS